MLFPFHASMCFLSGGYYSFYVYGGEIPALRYIDLSVYPWWMSLLFALAGASTFFALKKRTAAEYAKERVLRLLVPFVSGLLLWIPIQSFISDVFYNDYQGGFFRRYSVFFTKWTDLTGYDGGFTPGHLWFILFLFVISLVFLPLNAWYAKRDKKPELSKIPVVLLIVGGFVLLSAGGLVANVGGKGVLEFAICFLLGFFLFTDDKVIEKLKRNWILLGVACDDDIPLRYAECRRTKRAFWVSRFQSLGVDGRSGSDSGRSEVLGFQKRVYGLFFSRLFSDILASPDSACRGGVFYRKDKLR